MTSAWEVVEVLRMLSRPKHLLEEDAFYEGVALLGKIRDVGDRPAPPETELQLLQALLRIHIA